MAARSERQDGAPRVARHASRRTRGSWPETARERADRIRVIDAIQRVGHERLYFTVDDVRRDLQRRSGGRLAHPEQLSRHVHALQPVTVVSVGQPLGTLVEGGAGASMQHLYVLAEREPECNATPPDYPDPVRVYLALWVATEACGGTPVTTQAVTRVCQLVPELALRGTGLMNTRLSNLVNRAIPTAERVSPSYGGTGSRWHRWRPLGSRPVDPRLDGWIAFVKAASEEGRDLARIAGRTAHEIVADIVAIAVRDVDSSQWPRGRSVTIDEINAVCAENPAARALADELRARGLSRSRVLADAAKRRIGGRPRRRQEVVKVGAGFGGRPYYDVLGVPGIESRCLVAEVETLRSALATSVLDSLGREWKAASRLVGGRPAQLTPAERAVGAVRVLLVHQEIARLEAQLAALQERSAALSSEICNRLVQAGSELTGIRRRIGEQVDAEVTAKAMTQAAGVDLDAVLRASRPLLVGEAYAKWWPRELRGARTGPQLMASASALRRFPNPSYTARRDPHPERAAATGVDRVEGLVYVAERSASMTLAFLQDGADLLGRDYRDPLLPQLVLSSAVTDASWSGALAALALLGHDAAENAARTVLGDRGAPPRRLVHAIYALCVLRRWSRELLPPWLAWHQDPGVVRAACAADAALHSGGWLL